MYCLLDPLLAADADDRAYTLLDTPRGGDAGHADIVLIRELFNTFNDLLVGSEFTLVYKGGNELVGRSAL
jgi:hypothetical protein